METHANSFVGQFVQRWDNVFVRRTKKSSAYMQYFQTDQ